MHYIRTVTHPYLTREVVVRYLRMSGYQNFDVRDNLSVYHAVSWSESTMMAHDLRHLEKMADRRYHEPTVGEVGYW